MKLITRDTDYAVRATCFIAANENKVISAADMVKALGIPRPFLRKILQTLGRKHIIKSYKGPGGGFKMTASPKKVTLVSIIETFQGPISINECFFKKSLCPNRNSCVLKRKIDNIERYVMRELGSITIGELIKKG